jgi:hypothetical protein
MSGQGGSRDRLQGPSGPRNGTSRVADLAFRRSAANRRRKRRLLQRSPKGEVAPSVVEIARERLPAFEAVGRPFHNFRALRNQLALRHHPFVKSAAHRFGPAPPEAGRALPHSAPSRCARRSE